MAFSGILPAGGGTKRRYSGAQGEAATPRVAINTKAYNQDWRLAETGAPEQ